MSLWTRIVNLGRGVRLNREIDEELESHVAEAIEQGRDPNEARRAFGSALRQREESRDVKLIAWLDSLRADAIFGWRRLAKNKVTSAAAILSLALAIGACTSAFRLIDAVLLRPLPVANPERLFEAGSEGIDPGGNQRISDSFAYPLFTQMRMVARGQAELIAISDANRVDLTYKSDQEMEKAYLQYVSGWMFGSFGIKPALGRVLTESDDLTPRAHAYAVLSYSYWTRRFGNDLKVIGRTFRMGNDLYEIVGVSEEKFTGTEPGTIPDIFAPTMMYEGVTHTDWSWFRMFVQLKEGVGTEPLRTQLNAVMRTFNEERAKGFFAMPQRFMDNFLNQTLVLQPAAAGASDLRENYRRALVALGVLVALVLLIACANVANLMMGQAATRVREMALRVSIGAGRGRLVQLVLVESALVGFMAAAVGGLFAWRAAPFVVGMINPPDNPARLVLPADWRVLGFAIGLALGVTILFGLAPALRASGVKPVSALKGGEDPHSKRRFMHAMIAAQVAFCFLVLFISGLFVTTFERLQNQPMGFSAERILTLDTIAQQPQLPVYWEQVAEHLRSVPGVEAVGISGWSLMSGTGWNGFVSVNGGPPSQELAYFLNVSPGWLGVMKIPIISGRDFRPGDTTPGAAIVNEAFADTYFKGVDPIGRTFQKTNGTSADIRFEVVGVAGNARHRDMREPITPTAYVPFQSVTPEKKIDANSAKAPRKSGTFIVRTSNANPMVMARILREEVTRARAEFRVSNIRTQAELNQQHTVRERLLATLAIFFGGVALLLAGIGLYGVLHYSVVQRRREIGIRIAVGAQAGDVARLVTSEVLYMILTGAIAGVALGMGSVKYIESLLYEVRATSIPMLALPAVTILAAALLAALPAVIHAVRIDPVKMLRSE
jgi:putative ABC transport system permease protein